MGVGKNLNCRQLYTYTHVIFAIEIVRTTLILVSLNRKSNIVFHRKLCSNLNVKLKRASKLQNCDTPRTFFYIKKNKKLKMAMPQLDEGKMKLVQELEIEVMTDMYARLGTFTSKWDLESYVLI